MPNHLLSQGRRPARDRHLGAASQEHPFFRSPRVIETSPNMTRFVVLSTQRSGSTWMVEMLNSHPELHVYGELFLQDGVGTPARGAQDLSFFETYCARESVPQDDASKSEVITRYLSRVYTPRPGVCAAGFKLMYGQAGAYPTVVDYMREHHVSIVHLIRRNYLDVLLSKNAAVARERFHARVGETVPEIRMRLPLGDLLRQLDSQEREVKRRTRRFAALGCPYLEVYYEDLASGVASFDAVRDILGARNSHVSLKADMRKMNTQPHRAMIENYDAVCERLAGTPIAALLR